jgi:Pyruvate/2-oxoacid:ferredoxin oxidoreductase gamma subunit/Pyruvate/2-oxoacid:ferredoxin oxidoreductase delta subunit
MDSSGARNLALRLAGGEPIDLRGDGKAGGGLILAVQAFGAALARRGDLDVQDWPLFSSARKGARVRAFLRAARGRVEATCQVTAPDVALLMNDSVADTVDFAEGTAGAIYVLNTTLAPEAAADRFRLGGTILTIAGDALGERHLGRPLGNVAVLAALVRGTGLVEVAVARGILEERLVKRRLPERIVAANLSLFDEALEKVSLIERPPSAATDHRPRPFAGYGTLPAGAQSALRTSLGNRTAAYGRPGVHIEFRDPGARCNGCTLCVVQCPDGIIQFTPDPARGAIVTGAIFEPYCKVCRECVAACPLDLFHEVASVEPPEGAFPQGA